MRYIIKFNPYTFLAYSSRQVNMIKVEIKVDAGPISSTCTSAVITYMA